MPKTNFDISAALDSPEKQKMRARYIAQRFPKIADTHEALTRTDAVLSMAQQLIEEGRKSLAIELITLSLQEDATQRDLWRFLIEDAFLQADGALFKELTDGYAKQFERDEARPVIQAMAHDLSPALVSTQSKLEPIELPNWSNIQVGNRDTELQQKLHAALEVAAASLQAR